MCIWSLSMRNTSFYITKKKTPLDKGAMQLLVKIKK